VETDKLRTRTVIVKVNGIKYEVVVGEIGKSPQKTALRTDSEKILSSIDN